MFRNILKILSPISQIIFKIIILGLPLFAFMSLISFFRKSNYKSKRILNIVVILLWYSFLHILVHTASGANIDRYASPAIITSFIGIVLYINLLVEKIINRKKSIK
jgi:formate hydrogenlyase subunit 3/multisubunit Na+/H+ antiporter MnhD subunit